MIRRDTTLPGGEPGWLLISQIEHARLSGALAAEWGQPPFPAVTPRDELLPAIFRHDDGWADWERRPAIDPATGHPRNFMEMPVEDSLVIWRASIERAAAMSLLGGATVAGHFLHLLRQSLAWKEQGTRAAAAAHQWAAEFESLRHDWLDEWQAAHPEANTPEVSSAALAWLQFFDRLSLWFCMRRAAEPVDLSTAGGPALRLAPVEQNGVRNQLCAAPGGPFRQLVPDAVLQTVTLSPWPLRVASFETWLSARAVPARRYADAAALAAVRTALFTWRLRLLPAN
jgi:hypothetical protein